MPKELQKKVNDLYKEMDELVSEKLNEAKKANKHLLVAVADFHSALTSSRSYKNILIVQTILLDICKHRKINNYFTEGSERDRKTFEAMHCESGPFAQDHTCVDHKIARQNGFKFIALEKGFNPTLFSMPKFPSREKNMIDTILKYKDGIYICGFMHLKPLYESDALKKKFIVLPINGFPEVDQVVQMAPNDVELSGLTENELIARKNFIINSKKVFQPSIISNLISSLNADEVITMVEKASQWFHAQSLPTTSSPLDHMPHQKNSNQTLMQTALTSNNHNTVPSLPSAAETLSYGPFYSLSERFPWSVAFQCGFWVASQMGWCEKPRTTTTERVEFIQQICKTDEQLREDAAEAFLNEKGSSLENCLIEYFGKKYTEGFPKNRQYLKMFLIDMIVGDVDKEICKRFEEIASTNMNYHFRCKELAKLEQKTREERIEKASQFSRSFRK